MNNTINQYTENTFDPTYSNANQKTYHNSYSKTEAQSTQQRKTFADMVSQLEETTEDNDRAQEMKETFERLDKELEQIRKRTKREQKLIEAERIRRKKVQKKLLEKLSLKIYLARKDEIQQRNEQISIERAVGEDVYIWKAPLSKKLTAAEIREITSKY